MDEYNKYLSNEDYKKMYSALDKDKLVDLAVKHTNMLVHMNAERENTSRLGFIIISVVIVIGISIGIGISKLFL